MTDWPLMIFVICGGALILFIAILNITDLDSFFLALSVVVDDATALPALLTDTANTLIENVTALIDAFMNPENQSAAPQSAAPLTQENVVIMEGEEIMIEGEEIMTKEAN